jgi:4-amino-4-deoxy-L-arabinose transferase-like glycosyltransferase
MTIHNSFFTFLYRHKKLGLLFIIVSVGIALRLYCFHGFWGTDDAEYARLAHAMAQGTFSDFVKENYLEKFYGPAHLPFRIGVIFPLSLLFRLFGVNEWVLVVYPLSISILSILLAYFCGRVVFGVGAGLIASAIWAVLPINVQYATSFRPDIPVTFYTSLGIILLISIIHSNIKGKLSLFSIGGFAGLLFGISWVCKETILYFVPFCAVLLFISVRKNWKDGLSLWAGVATASLGVIIIEMIIYHNLRGDFLFRFHEIERSYIQTKSYLFFEGSRFGWAEGSSYLKALLKRLLFEGPKIIFLNDQYLYLPFFGIIAWAHSLYWKNKGFLIPFLWMIIPAFMYNFSSHSLSSYIPLVLYDSYLLPMIFPAALLTSGFIEKLLSNKVENREIMISRERIFWGIVLTALLIGISSYETFRAVRDIGRTKSIYETRIASSILKPSDRIYTDPLSRKSLEFFWRYPEEMNVIDFENMKGRDITSNSFVLLDCARLNYLKVNVGMWLTKDYGYKEPNFFERPPHSWKRVWGNANAALYHVR